MTYWRNVCLQYVDHYSDQHTENKHSFNMYTYNYAKWSQYNQPHNDMLPVDGRFVFSPIYDKCVQHNIVVTCITGSYSQLHLIDVCSVFLHFHDKNRTLVRQGSLKVYLQNNMYNKPNIYTAYTKYTQPIQDIHNLYRIPFKPYEN